MKEYYYESRADSPDYFHFRFAVNNEVAAHFHNTTELVFVTSGSVNVAINGESHALSPGDIAVSNRFDVHFYETPAASEMYVMLLGGAYTRRFYQVFGKNPENFMLGLDTARIFTLLADFYQEYDSPAGMNELTVKGSVDVLLGRLADLCPMKDIDLGEQGLMIEILKYIEVHYAENLSLEGVSGQFGYTKNHFSKLFNQYIGMHFRDYLNRLRIKKMERSEGDGSITALATEHGFESLSTYYRALKKFKGG